MLSKYVGDKVISKWDEYIDRSLLACRVRIHHSTGKTLFYMVYGIEPKLPGDKLRPLLNDSDENDTQARIQQIQQLDKQRALVDQRLHSNANKMKIYYDKHL
ncbi:unnamed protein product, partial [Didymodactylos carnosus]